MPNAAVFFKTGQPVKIQKYDVEQMSCLYRRAALAASINLAPIRSSTWLSFRSPASRCSVETTATVHDEVCVGDSSVLAEAEGIENRLSTGGGDLEHRAISIRSPNKRRPVEIARAVPDQMANRAHAVVARRVGERVNYHFAVLGRNEFEHCAHAVSAA